MWLRSAAVLLKPSYYFYDPFYKSSSKGCYAPGACRISDAKMQNNRLRIFRIKTIHTGSDANLRVFNKSFGYWRQLICRVGGTAAEEREKVMGDAM